MVFVDRVESLERSSESRAAMAMGWPSPQHLIVVEGCGVVEAARNVGWSKVTSYRHRAASDDSR